MAAVSSNAISDPLTESQIQAQRIFRKLTGKVLAVTDPRMAQMDSLIVAGDQLGAAKIASADRSFYSSTLLNVVAPWSEAAGSQLTMLDDMQATAIGIVRDRLDIRMLLTSTFRYQGNAASGARQYSLYNNDHYKDLDSSGADLASVLERVEKSSREKVGVLNLRGFGAAYYSAGTNRRAVKFSFKNFLCKDITTWRDARTPDYFVRRDVDRAPSGNYAAYQAECRGCHAPMDAMAGAFAYMDFKFDELQTLDEIAPKYNQNITVFPDGYVTVDGAWVNFLVANQQSTFGWRSPTEGSTLEDFATMLAQSRAFSECMVSQAVDATCHNREQSLKRNRMVQQLTDHLETSGYDLRDIFELASFHPDC